MKRVPLILIILVLAALLSLGIGTLIKSGKAISVAVQSEVIGNRGQVELKRLNRLSRGFEKAMATHISLRSILVDINGLAWLVLNRKIVDEPAIVKDKNGSLHPLPVEVLSDQLIDGMIENLKKLKSVSEFAGAILLFIQAPFKLPAGYDLLPYGLTDDSNISADRFLSRVATENIPFLDLRRSLSAEALQGNTAFYRTDHHWNTEAAFQAVREVTLWVHDASNGFVGLVAPNRQEFNSKTWGRRFLGSRGIRTGRLYTPADDFTILLPKHSTNFQFQSFRGKKLVLSANGSFETALIDLTKLEGAYTNSYMSFLHGAVAESRIKNLDMPNAPRVLLISDSFGRAFAPYLAFSCSDLRFVDPQKGRFEQDIEEYVSNYKPDIILVMFNAGAPYFNSSFDEESTIPAAKEKL